MLIEQSVRDFESFRSQLEIEFKAITDIGNNFLIRHHEHDKADLPGDAAVDYLFIRLAALIAFVGSSRVCHRRRAPRQP